MPDPFRSREDLPKPKKKEKKRVKGGLPSANVYARTHAHTHTHKKNLRSDISDSLTVRGLSNGERRRSGQSVTASDFGSNGPRFESGRGRCVESLDKALYSHCPKEKPSH